MFILIVDKVGVSYKLYDNFVHFAHKVSNCQLLRIKTLRLRYFIFRYFIYGNATVDSVVDFTK